MSWKSFIKKPLFVIGGLFAVSSVAYAFPWDIDLVDTPFLRGYEWHMQSPAEGTVSVNHYRPHSYSDDLMAQSNNDNRVALTIRPKPLIATDHHLDWTCQIHNDLYPPCWNT